MSEEHCPCGQPGVTYTGDDVLVCQACYDAIPATPARSEAAGGEEVDTAVTLDYISAWLISYAKVESERFKPDGARYVEALTERTQKWVTTLRTCSGEIRVLRHLLTTAEREAASLRQQLAAIAEREAAVCPEDVGFDEYIRALQKQLAAAREDGERLRRDFRSLSEAIQEGSDPESCWAYLQEKQREIAARAEAGSGEVGRDG